MLGVSKQFEQATGKLENKLDRVQTYVQQVVKEQERLIEVAETRNHAINRDLKALRFRLKPYTGKSPRGRDELYYKLKSEYEEMLQRRSMNGRTITVAEETIEYARLNTLPGQTYQSGEQL